ncbi:MAG: hypothetical protein QOK16_1181 [Solirubrobacteraceae bacterium]|nr:hypothetical protein [Solirubrobacteraceae bacterium]MEA2183868.1 hypothetical protein [Solirubrobacteraceae bacterium]MEA2186170.1 hypothetical protein [Solirubrobacteraceae bacterium]
MSSIPTAAPGAYKVFAALDGQEFPTPSAFGDAYYRVVRRLWGTLGVAFENRDAMDWALQTGVIRRDGERVIVSIGGLVPGGR